MKNYGLLLVLMSAVFVSCSNDDKGLGGASVEAQFIDAPVKGLSFSATSGDGKTGDNGKFSCVEGETINFTLKGYKVGYAVCRSQIFVHELKADLTNHVAGHWQNAASVLQTFSKMNGSQLDLTDFNASSIADLSILNGSNDMDADLSVLATVDFPHVNISAAEGNANDALVTYVKLSTALQEILDEVVPNQTTPIYFHAVLKSEVPAGADWCNHNLKIVADLFKVNQPAAIANTYALSARQAIGYQGDDQITKDDDFYVCAQNATDCAIYSGALLPSQKIITSTKIEMTGFGLYDEPSDVGNGTMKVQSRNAFTLNTKPVNGDLEIKGTLVNESEIIENNEPTSDYPAGSKVKCTYDVSLFEFNSI